MEPAWPTLAFHHQTASPARAGGSCTPGDPVLRFAFYRYEYEKLTRYIGLAMVLGVLVGYLCNKYAQNAQEAKQIASYFSLITDIFLRMIKMIIAPWCSPPWSRAWPA